MTVQLASQGNLFTSGFLTDTIEALPDWKKASDAELDALETALRDIYVKFGIDITHTEADTETDLIFPVLNALGWTATLTQQNLSVAGRKDIPDGLLFADDAAKAQATQFAEHHKRFQFALAVVESKRWQRPLDRSAGKRDEDTAPSTQMLRYLDRMTILTDGKLRWGMLTNGAKWRLYFSGARSVSEEFFELDLATILDLKGHNDGLFALTAEDRRHWLRIFLLTFRCAAFQPLQAGKKTFHQIALQEGKTYEERVANDLSKKVFEQVFPELVQALVKAAPSASLQDVRQGALILLYRLLFILYAEDRDLLPVRDTRYDDYGLRNKVRFDVQARKDRNDTFSETMPNYWNAMTNLFVAIDEGDASIGLP